MPTKAPKLPGGREGAQRERESTSEGAREGRRKGGREEDNNCWWGVGGGLSCTSVRDARSE